CPLRENPPQFVLADPVLRGFLSVEEQHRNLHAVPGFERRIGRDVHLLERERHTARDAAHDRFHFLAEMAPRARVERQAGYDAVQSLSSARVSTVSTRSS